MKLKPSNSLVPILVIGILLSVPVIGQGEKTEAVMRYEANSELEPDPEEVEAKAPTKYSSGVLCDSVVVQPKIVKPVSVPTKVIDKNQKPVEDPLSFNFLYYIIEKFKMSDMIQ